MSLHLVYVDEAGDDGYPGQSPFFVLSAVYFHYMHWPDIFENLLQFRRSLRAHYGLPVRTEIHARPLLRLKKPYNEPLRISRQNACNIISDFCTFISQQPLRIINVVVRKKALSPEQPPDILDLALTYLAQRIENDLSPTSHPENRALLITDAGREASMRRILRRRRRYNPVPSRFGGVRHLPLKSFLEDPLSKSSSQSYFLQMADCAATVAYLYAQTLFPEEAPLPKRIRKTLRAQFTDPHQAVKAWMEALYPVLNIHASRYDDYGVVFIPSR